jgi:hypothetical protein
MSKSIVSLRESINRLILETVALSYNNPFGLNTEVEYTGKTGNQKGLDTFNSIDSGLRAGVMNLMFNGKKRYNNQKGNSFVDIYMSDTAKDSSIAKEILKNMEDLGVSEMAINDIVSKGKNSGEFFNLCKAITMAFGFKDEQKLKTFLETKSIQPTQQEKKTFDNLETSKDALNLSNAVIMGSEALKSGRSKALSFYYRKNPEKMLNVTKLQDGSYKYNFGDIEVVSKSAPNNFKETENSEIFKAIKFVDSVKPMKGGLNIETKLSVDEAISQIDKILSDDDYDQFAMAFYKEDGKTKLMSFVKASNKKIKVISHFPAENDVSTVTYKGFNSFKAIYDLFTGGNKEKALDKLSDVQKERTEFVINNIGNFVKVKYDENVESQKKELYLGNISKK